ncbi:MAG: VOC family protein [bacterium]|nr:VOC family protein [bacterium]
MQYQSITANIGVKNVNETVQFYTEKLGFDLVMSNPEEGEYIWAMVSNGHVILMFQDDVNLKEEYPELSSAGKGNITFYVKIKGMVELFEQLRDSNLIVKPLAPTPYGVAEFAIRDNNGYILTIAEA